MKKLLAMGAFLSLAALAEGFSAGIDAGIYDGNLSGSLSLIGADSMAGANPLSWRVGVSYSASDVLERELLDPTSEESGYSLVTFVDGLYSMTSEDDLIEAGIYAGPRFRYLNGSVSVSEQKILQIDSSSFGLGAGAFANYPLSERASLSLDAGMDYFINPDIMCDGINTDPETLFCEEIEDNVAASSLVIKARIGVSYAIGGVTDLE